MSLPCEFFHTQHVYIGTNYSTLLRAIPTQPQHFIVNYYLLPVGAAVMLALALVIVTCQGLSLMLLVST